MEKEPLTLGNDTAVVLGLSHSRAVSPGVVYLRVVLLRGVPVTV